MGIGRAGLDRRLSTAISKSAYRIPFPACIAPFLFSVAMICLCALLVLPATRIAHAQDQAPAQPLVNPGDALVTGFSGVRKTDGGVTPETGKADGKLLLIDPDGASLRGFDLGNPGAKGPLGQPLAPEFLSITAREIGQVFGIALEDATDPSTGLPAPNIYATATSAYGLAIVGPDKDGNGVPERLTSGAADAKWMAGLFGEKKGGGPGSVWKIDGITGEVTLFANITHDNKANAGAALGNISFDAKNRQFFVSDRDTGLIHRLDMDGNERDTFDHGATGRGAAGLEPVNLDTGNRADITKNTFKMTDPSTWGLADPRRRIWGLAVHEGRLYYAMAEGPQIWSVALLDGGGFDVASARREIDVADEAGTTEVADIAFTPGGQIILAQRPPVKGVADFGELVAAEQAAVVHYQRDEPGVPGVEGEWGRVPGEYPVGFEGEHRSASGGVALGYGYSQTGGIDRNTCSAMVWATGDALRKSPLKAAGLADGIQGRKTGHFRGSGKPPPARFIIDYDGQYPEARQSGHVGEIEIASRCPGEPGAPPAEPEIASGEAPVPPGPGVLPPVPPGPPSGPPPPEVADLSIEKRLTGACLSGGDCAFEIIITNQGPAVYQGPLFLSDTISVPGVTLAANAPAPWNCQQAGDQISCNHPTLLLKPGHPLSLPLTLRAPGDPNIKSWDNCVALKWLGQAAIGPTAIRAVQTELAGLGYYTGPIDGVAGGGTRKAIRDLQKASRLPETGKITPDFLDWLFGAGASTATDPNTTNDTACVTVPMQPTTLKSTLIVIDKIGLSSECYANKTCKFKITMTNKGPAPYKGALKFTDKMPNGWSYVGAQPAGWHCQSKVAGQVTCDLPVPLIWPPITTLKVGESKDVVVELNVPQGQKQGEVENCATFDVAQGQNNPTACTKVKIAAKSLPFYGAGADLAVEKGPSHPAITTLNCSVDAPCKFSVTITNKGALPYTGPIIIKDKLLPGFKLASWKGPSICQQQGNIFSCGQVPYPTLAPGKSVKWDFELKLPSSAPSTVKYIENCAEIDWKTGPGDTNKANDRGCTTIVVAPGPPHLQITKTKVAPKQCERGKDCVYTITVKNIGKTAHEGPVSIEDRNLKAAGMKLTTYAPQPPWVCQEISLGKYRCDHPARTLKPGDSLPMLYLVVFIPKTLDEQISALDNCAAITQGKGKIGPESCVQTPIKPLWDLEVHKSGPKSCTVWQACVFHISVINSGTAPYRGPLAVVENHFIKKPKFLTSTPKPWKCEAGPAAGTITCKHPFVVLKPKKPMEDLDIEVRVETNLPPGVTAVTLKDCAKVFYKGGQPDANPKNDQSCLETPLYRFEPHVQGVMAAPASSIFFTVFSPQGVSSCKMRDLVALTTSSRSPTREKVPTTSR